MKRPAFAIAEDEQPKKVQRPQQPELEFEPSSPPNHLQDPSSPVAAAAPAPNSLDLSSVDTADLSHRPTASSDPNFYKRAQGYSSSENHDLEVGGLGLGR
jgi:hypothetical protein